MNDKILSEVSAIMGERPATEIARATVEKYWPGSMTWDEIVATVRSWSDGPISRDEAYSVMHIAGILGVFGFPPGSQFREEKRVSERDTQFAGFAALVLKEVDDAVAAMNDIDVRHKEFANRLGTIIARRAYDFACHVVSNTSEEDHAFMDSTQGLVAQIPDLTELPEGPR